MQMRMLKLGFALAATMLATAALGADYPAPKAGDWIAKDFKFHTGEVQEVRLHYLTVGDPQGEPVLVLHGTGGSGANFIGANYADQMFGPGQPLDANKYFIILPDALGAGQSSKPSDGLKAGFPKYNYDDMVSAQYRLVTEGLGLKHLRLVTGNSQGGMHTWLWGEKYPTFMDALIPMAATPGEMSARNWMLRRTMVEMVTSDAVYNNGNYTTQPPSMKLASIFYGIATSGGTLGYQTLAPTRAAADKLVNDRLAAAPPADANDFVYQWSSSADYNPSPGLEQIQAPLLAVNSADDERNPPETGIMEKALKAVKNGRAYIIPASTETRGHATTGMASFWKKQFSDFLGAAPRLSQ
jgi:homoserine O-acetyltransferase